MREDVRGKKSLFTQTLQLPNPLSRLSLLTVRVSVCVSLCVCVCSVTVGHSPLEINALSLRTAPPHVSISVTDVILVTISRANYSYDNNADLNIVMYNTAVLFITWAGSNKSGNKLLDKLLSSDVKSANESLGKKKKKTLPLCKITLAPLGLFFNFLLLCLSSPIPLPPFPSPSPSLLLGFRVLTLLMRRWCAVPCPLHLRVKPLISNVNS